MKLKEGLVVEKLADGGILVVDEAEGQSHALAPKAAAVWSCVSEGIVEPAMIAERTALDDETVHRALVELAECELIDASEASSRRQMLSRAATIAGAAAGLKLIESIATPAPAAAQSATDGATAP